MEAWNGFQEGIWQNEIQVRDFIITNFETYDGDSSFLASPTDATRGLWAQVMRLSLEERERGGVWDMDTKTVSTITSHGPGYLDSDKEKIVGVQTNQPFKRSLQPFGGIRMAVTSAKSYGFDVDEEVQRIFTTFRKTHNQGVFDAYTKEMLAARKSGIITGLPDAYGRGRIIGDYRRVALYGVDFLMNQKKKEHEQYGGGHHVR